MGSDYVIDYNKEKVTDLNKKFDVIMNFLQNYLSARLKN
jgi:hypothetical protein